MFRHLLGHPQVLQENRSKSCLCFTTFWDPKYSFFNYAARRGGWSTPRPGRFTPGKDPVPIVYEAGLAPGLVWTGAENLVNTRIRSPYRTCRSKSLCYLIPVPSICMCS